MGRRDASIALGALVLLLAGCQSVSDKAHLEDARAAIDEHEAKALQRLFKAKPEAKAELDGAVAHAVFVVRAGNAILLVGQEGKGVLVEHGSGKRTYMFMMRAGTGPGLGYQVIARVIALKSQAAVEQFTLGGKAGVDFGAQETIGTYNLEQSVNPSLKFWDLDEFGFAVQAYWGATTYIVDPDLN